MFFSNRQSENVKFKTRFHKGVYNLLGIAGRIIITSMKYGRIIDFLSLIVVL